MPIMKRLCGVIAVLLFPIAGTAANFDGSKNLLCAPADIAECGIGPECAGVTTDETNVPEFIAVDFKAKRLSDGAQGGSTETTAIQNVREVDGRLILQGAESGRAWSIVVDQSTGGMAATVAAVAEDGVRVGFVLFGSCMVTR